MKDIWPKPTFFPFLSVDMFKPLGVGVGLVVGRSGE